MYKCNKEGWERCILSPKFDTHFSLASIFFLAPLQFISPSPSLSFSRSFCLKICCNQSFNVINTKNNNNNNKKRHTAKHLVNLFVRNSSITDVSIKQYSVLILYISYLSTFLSPSPPSLCFSVCLSLCAHVSVSTYLHVCPSICLSVYLCLPVSRPLFFHLSIICLFRCLSLTNFILLLFGFYISPSIHSNVVQ